jgi:hypothetical protein
MSKKILIELTEDEVTLLEGLARRHGNRTKPFIEYLIRLQLGTVPLPTVAPVAMPEQEPVNGKPRTNEPQQAIPKTETQAQKPVKSRPTKEQPQEDDIQERFGMFTYKGSYYGTLQEAEAAKG